MKLNTQKIKSFFYRYWKLFYLILFLLLGLLIYALTRNYGGSDYSGRIAAIEKRFDDCCNRHKNAPTVIDTTRLAADPLPPDETLAPPVKDLPCDQKAESGTQGTSSIKHELGSRSGRVIIDYDMDNIPDEMKVIYDGKLVAQTGSVSGKNTLEWNYVAVKGRPTYCIVIIKAPNSGTKWNYTVNCPQ